jgi:hypothetical protein
MRRGRLIAVACLAFAAATGQAKNLSVEDVDRGFARLGLQVSAEKVVHRGERLLLVRIQATGVRTIDRGDGRMDSVSLKDRGLAFLPVGIACGRAVLREDGKSSAPHVSSPCADAERLSHAQALPVFVAFRYPVPGKVSIVVPVTVTNPDPPIQVSLRKPAAISTPNVTSALLGDRELSVRVGIE